MKTVKKMSVFLALIVMTFASACTEIEVDPRGGGDEDIPPIIVPPPVKKSAPMDTTSIG